MVSLGQSSDWLAARLLKPAQSLCQPDFHSLGRVWRVTRLGEQQICLQHCCHRPSPSSELQEIIASPSCSIKQVTPLCLLFFLFSICKPFSSAVSSVLCKKIKTTYFHIKLTSTALFPLLYLCISGKVKCSPYFCEYSQFLRRANNSPPQTFPF